MSGWTWSDWITGTPSGDHDVPAEVRPGDVAQADLIARPHQMECCQKTSRPIFIGAFRFPVVTGEAWMAVPPPPGVRTTHFGVRNRVHLDDADLPLLQAEEVPA